MSGRGGGGGRGDHRGGGGGGARRFESKSKAPPSRHLWVGNLAHSITEEELTRHFAEFGELESAAFQPGRSYAFLNFKSDEDAIAAMEALQGFPVAGNPLRVEFTKADKSSAPSRDEDYSIRRDEQRSAVRGPPLMQREFRALQGSPEQSYKEKTSMGDRNTEPSEVLWIGFPVSLKVDEFILRKSFSPFGEIEKITAFPGRSYAFVRYRSVMSATRAKDALQGKLFGNSRVHICFARSDSGSSNSGRNLMNEPSSPHLKLNGRSGSSERYRQDRKFGSLGGDPSIRSPQYFSNVDSFDYDPYSSKRKGENNTCEPRRFGESDVEVSEDMYGHQASPTRDKYGRLSDYSQKFPQKNLPYEEPWDLPDDLHSFHGPKRLKTESYIPDKELPEYPMSVYEQEKHGFPRSFSDFHQPDSSNRNYEAEPFGYKQIPERPMNLALPPVERGDLRRESYGNLQACSQRLNPVDRKRFTPESNKPLDLWKWEGTIAKGGTPVCRARCFPVGKVLDMILPEFLDCTARTGLDMLSKHYDQATSAWVVFFAPESDADIGYYNEFMQYLGEKQRAAVAKLDDRTTLFLVPPSDFSEKVLKVPGKVSISGVVLRLDQPNFNFGSLPQPHERNDTRLSSFPRDQPFTKPLTSSVSVPPFTQLPDSNRAGISNLSFPGNYSAGPPTSFSNVGGYNPYNENRHEYPLQKESPGGGPNRPSHHSQNSVSGTRNRPNLLMENTVVDPILQERPSTMQRAVQEVVPHGGISRIQNSNLPRQDTQSPPTPLAALQPEQLARLASLLGQQNQPGSTQNLSTGEAFRHRNPVYETDNQPRTSQKFAQQNNQVTSEPSTSQFGQFQPSQPPQAQNTVQRDFQSGGQGNPQLQQSINTNEVGEPDPQKRHMQATLQLAAALLQQIQQGKGS